MSGAAPSGRYYIETWGCQMNAHDSEKMAGVLTRLGYEPAATAESADVVLLNTCAIRERATEKVFSELGRLRILKERRPDLLLGVAGCVAPLEGEGLFRRAPWVDLVVGPRSIARLPALIEAAHARGRAIDVTHHPESVLFPWQDTIRSGGPTARITIIEGCNKACSFCVVPQTRGREASRVLEDVLEETRRALEGGAREIEFLGQTVNAYKDPQGRGLADLLRAADGQDGLVRMRFTTSHPVHMSTRLIAAMAECERLARSLHLPVQSGSDRVLGAMARGYTRADYVARIGRLRAALPGLGLSTDIIVGFPGETAAEFEETLSLLDEIGFDTVYSFLYSPRPGTDAAEIEDPTPFEEKADRLARLQESQGAIQLASHRSWVGRAADVLVSGPAKSGEGLMTGRTREGRIVNFPAGPSLVGMLVSVEIIHAGPYSLGGRLAAAGPVCPPPAAVS